MSFPLSFKGKVVVPALRDPAVAVMRVAAHLRVEGLLTFDVVGNALKFRVGMFTRLSGHHHPLAMLTSATVVAANASEGVILE